ncbi:MAG TPA: class I SAM-dependent methyltransferase [Candidatus Polarisedimenticolia bacterium]|jgi:SAM-dependent methyltransferase|nr:class I SAM-dependent methyltransferase [Candidatus Polarisedimenticolia bacterium]
MDPSMYRAFAELHERRHWWFVGRRRIVASILASVLGDRRNLEILDIGCGTGGMIPLLRPFGRVTAIDPSEEAILYSSERYSGQAILRRVDFPREPPPRERYDLVTLFDVLEHLDDDREALSKAARLLGPGGRLILTVPAHRSLWSPHDEINQHRRRYARAELQGRIREAGLRLLRMTYFNALLLPAVWAARRIRRGAALEGDRRSDFRIQTGWMNNFLAAVFGAERFLLRAFDLPLGVSLLAIAAPGEPAVR